MVCAYSTRLLGVLGFLGGFLGFVLTVYEMRFLGFLGFLSVEGFGGRIMDFACSFGIC